MDDRQPIPTTAALVASLERLGLNRPGVPDRHQVSVKRLRSHIVRRMADDFRGDESIVRALDELHALDRFRNVGVSRLLGLSPSLRVQSVEGSALAWYLTISVEVSEEPSVAFSAEVEIGDDILTMLRALPSAVDFEAALPAVVSAIDTETRSRGQRLRDKVRAWRPRLDAALAKHPGREAALCEAMQARLKAHRDLPRHRNPEQLLSGALTKALNHAIGIDRERQGQERLRSVVGYPDYVEQLKASRGPRRVIFNVGPTNSGKTHGAMEALAAAATGLYLAPLRLLALEGYERLCEAGLNAGMVTGEEVLGAERPTHLSQTIETASLTRTVDVVVIDEIQMLGDRDRGWAWTRALFGARCETLILCGAEEAMPLVLRAGEILGEEIEVVRHERKTPLSVERRPVSVRDVVAGDAVIAFSRRDVHFHREILLQRGLPVATIYGGLSPEVRRAEAARFRSGEATVLVATDAIGMGLNLGPLRRVIFSEMTKYDGVSERPLEPEEIRQIAGRAGRFGHHEAGYVAVMSGSAVRVENALTGPVKPKAGDGRFPVRPEPEMMEAAAREIGTKSLVRLLTEFSKRTVYEGSPFKPSDVDETIERARSIDELDLTIPEKFAFAICPIDGRSTEARMRLVRFATALARGVAAPLPASGGRRAFGGADLMDHENEVKMISSYLWLARRFPETFPDYELAVAERAKANLLIEERLSESATRKARKAGAA